jgi:LPS export ABC transporter protein LptC
MKNLKMVFVVIVVVLLIYYCKNNLFSEHAKEPKILSPLKEEEPFSGERVRIFSIAGFSDSGKKQWQMEGKSADIFADIIELYDVNADSFGGDVKVSLKADRGEFDRKTNDIKLKENVVIETDESTSLYTQSLNWDARHELVSTEDKVSIKRKEMDVSGIGALSKYNLKIAQLNHDVKVDLKDPPAVITCDGPLEVDYEKNIAYFNTNVEVIDKEASIKTDKAIAYFEPKKKSLKMVFCQGNVSIKRGEDVTYAQQLTYIPGEGRIVLEGRPKIIIRSAKGFLEKLGEKEEKKSE